MTGAAGARHPWKLPVLSGTLLAISYFSFALPVRAPADGVVVEIENGQTDDGKFDPSTFHQPATTEPGGQRLRPYSVQQNSV